MRLSTRAPALKASTASPLGVFFMTALAGLTQVALTASPAMTAPSDPASSNAAAQSTDSLAATWETPWNPDHAISRRQMWEQVVLLPGRIVSLPLSALGMLTDGALGVMEQSQLALFAPAKPGPRSLRPLAVSFSHLGDRTGIGAAITAQTGLPRSLKSVLGVEYAGTNKFYNRTQLTWTGKPLSLQVGYEWRPQDRFYGSGTSSSKDSISDYAMQREFIRTSARWSWGHDVSTDRPRAVLNAWAGPRSEVTRNGRGPGQIHYAQRFPGFAAPTLNARVEHFVYGTRWLVDHRAGAPHWSRGWRVLASAEQFGAPVRALALHSAAGNGATFSRYDIEAETGVSMFRDPRTLRIAMHLTDQQVTSGRDRFLTADLATLGGRRGLGGFAPGRFHDLDLLLTRVTYVFPLVRRLEMNVHSEWGAVYADLWQDARLGSLHHSMGLAIHSRSERAPRGALGVDVSREGVWFLYTLGGVE